MPKFIFIGVVLLAGAHAWPQVADLGADAATNVEDHMLIPPPVSGRAYPVALDSEERANLLHYGLAVSYTHLTLPTNREV